MIKTELEIEIEVTRDDLDNGIRNSGMNCPIALACKRAIGDQLEMIEVDGETIRIEVNDHLYETDYIHSQQIKEFVTRFDKEDHVSPFKKKFKFLIQEPDEDYDQEDY